MDPQPTPNTDDRPKTEGAGTPPVVQDIKPPTAPEEPSAVIEPPEEGQSLDMPEADGSSAPGAPVLPADDPDSPSPTANPVFNTTSAEPVAPPEEPADSPSGVVAPPEDLASPVVPTTPELPAHTEHKGSRKLVVMVVILVALILAAAAIFIYLRTKDSAEPNTTSNNQATDQSTQLSANDVESASTDIENTVNELDDAKDFNADDISDTALGL